MRLPRVRCKVRQGAFWVYFSGIPILRFGSMKRETQTLPGGSKFDRPAIVRPVRNARAWFALAVGLAIVVLPLAVAPAAAGGASMTGPETPDAKRPKAERHLELRRVLSAPREAGAGSDNRRKLSSEERKALRESMRGAYDPRDPRDERGFNSRP